MGFDFFENSDLEEVTNIKLQNQTNRLFQKAFDCLKMLQQLVLLACSLFDSEVQVDVLYEVCVTWTSLIKSLLSFGYLILLYLQVIVKLS